MVEKKEEFKITNLEGATWAFKKLKAIDEKEAEIKEVAAKEIETVKQWEQKELDQYERDRDYFNFLLNSYYREQRRINKKFKLSTPWGKVTSRKTQQIFIKDEAQALKHFEESDIKAIRVKKELDKKYINTNYKGGIDQITGEILPFMYVEDIETITIKID